MNAIEQYFHVVLLITLFKVVPTFKSVAHVCLPIEMKAIEQHFRVVLLVMLYKVVLIVVIAFTDRSMISSQTGFGLLISQYKYVIRGF